MRRLRLLVGISLLWLPLSMLSDGITTLVLPVQLGSLLGRGTQATALGLLTFLGLLLGALVQPFAGALSDRLRPALRRNGFIGAALLLCVAALAGFGLARNLPGVIAAYLGLQLAASTAQAGQQGLIPDLVDQGNRGAASGMKGFMDIAGAMAGFAVLGSLLNDRGLAAALTAIGVALGSAYLLAWLLTSEDRRALPAARFRPFSTRDAFHIDFRRHRSFARLVLARFLFLLGIYATGRFLLYFVAGRLRLPSGPAAEQAGNILALLALVTVLASPIAGWLADRYGRLPLMFAGGALGALSCIALIFSHTGPQIVLSGSLMSLGTAAFSGGSWALLADLVPRDEAARFFGLANLGTAGSSALAGLLGPVVDIGERTVPGSGFTILFGLAALAFLATALPLTSLLSAEETHAGRSHPHPDTVRTDGAGLAVLHLPADPADPQEHQDPQAGPTAP